MPITMLGGYGEDGIGMDPAADNVGQEDHLASHDALFNGSNRDWAAFPEDPTQLQDAKEQAFVNSENLQTQIQMLEGFLAFNGQMLTFIKHKLLMNEHRIKQIDEELENSPIMQEVRYSYRE